MTQNEFLKLNSKYRIIPEFSEDLNEIIDSYFIYCNCGKARIYMNNDDTLFILYFSTKYDTDVKLKEIGVEVENYSYSNGEITFESNIKNLNKLCEFLKAYKTGKNPVSVNSKSKNRSYWVRTQRNIDSKIELYFKNNFKKEVE